MLLLLLLSHFSRVRLCADSVPTLCHAIDGSPSGSPIPGILQARILEWVAISFSSTWKWKVKVKSLSRVWLLVTPWAAAYQASPSVGFSRQEYWSWLPLPSPRLGNSSYNLGLQLANEYFTWVTLNWSHYFVMPILLSVFSFKYYSM